ncbi:flagellar biosynthesis protein FlhB [Sphingomonas ginkgonis]|uniref:Flagellar biosynthesis protein FlhB n=1 Tax=Sphingomonas ginkgonis TaxID=2315330 RepID=A0A429VC55_9SPHN|nr:flagellar type III secretion system protein FlhB [Sphingomonas ginkgonis]RST31558.1 flagellar biosynthesis protein FlhB [Sphingomonas ginkgonis]
MAGEGEKTEAATPRRKQEAVKQGDLLKSKELGTALVVAAGAGWAWLAGPLFVGGCRDLLTRGLTFRRAELLDFDPARSLAGLLVPVALPLAALFALCLAAAAAGPLLMGSFGFRAGAFAFKPSRLNPLAGAKRIFSAQGLIELVKSLAKVGLLGGIGYWLIAHHVRALFGLGSLDIASSTASIGLLFRTALVALTGGLLAIALIDVPAEIFQRNRRLRMTKEEVREDHRQTEGSPELKRMVRQRQHEVLSGSARKSVREATVVLTNPTHFAIALRYDPTKDAAPLVVARGRGETALAIRSLAKDGSVPILEYPQLTRAIYFTSRAGQVVAEDLYLAIATVLAFVFRLEQSLADGIEQPSVLVPENRRFDENGRPLGA